MLKSKTFDLSKENEWYLLKSKNYCTLFSVLSGAKNLCSWKQKISQFQETMWIWQTYFGKELLATQYRFIRNPFIRSTRMMNVIGENIGEIEIRMKLQKGFQLIVQCRVQEIESSFFLTNKLTSFLWDRSSQIQLLIHCGLLWAWPKVT